MNSFDVVLFFCGFAGCVELEVSPRGAGAEPAGIPDPHGNVLIIALQQSLHIKHLHLHLGHLADAFIQSDLQRVHLLKERQQYITVVHKDKNRAGLEHS